MTQDCFLCVFPMKIAFVVPRLEPQLAGGAEVYCQKLTEKIVQKGYQVDLLTTCARDHFSWKNHYEPGNKIVNGVTVRRFLVDSNRVTPRFLMIQRKIDHRLPISEREELWWMEDSVRSQKMEEFIVNNKLRYDWFIFIPYLFGTTYWGIERVREKSLLIPCLHDEPFAYLDIFKKMFNKVRGIMFNTYPEIELAKKLYGLPEEKITMVSLGFELKKEYDGEKFRNMYGIYDPFILFAGRREGGKNIDMLLKYFHLYKRYNNSRIKLVLLGSGHLDLTPEDKDNIFDLGYLGEESKYNAYSAALAFCQPSANESLSIVIMESWLCARPVLVNSSCAVTKDHCMRSQGGLYFGNFQEFEGCINYLLSNKEIADKMGVNGRVYVKENYSWDAVLKRFDDSLKRFSEK